MKYRFHRQHIRSEFDIFLRIRQYLRSHNIRNLLLRFIEIFHAENTTVVIYPDISDLSKSNAKSYCNSYSAFSAQISSLKNLA